MKITSGRQANSILRALRTRAGFTRPQLARRLHISAETLYDRDAGRRGLSVDALAETAAEFGLDVALVPRGTPTAGLIAIDAQRNLGALLRDLRRRAGLSLADLADRLQMTKGGLGHRETAAQAMTVAVLAESLDALGYDLIAAPRSATVEQEAAA